MKNNSKIVANAIAANRTVAINDAPTFGEFKDLKREYMATMKEGESVKRQLQNLDFKVSTFAKKANDTLAKVKKWVDNDYMDDDDLASAKDFAMEADRLTIAMRYAYPAIRDNF